MSSDVPQVPYCCTYVIDGWHLLHSIPWDRNTTFREIIQKYVTYIKTHYGTPIIVFDGYEISSTKDMTHKRRLKNKSGLRISFNRDIEICVSKETFLNNKCNKQYFIKMLGKDLEDQGQKIMLI